MVKQIQKKELLKKMPWIMICLIVSVLVLCFSGIQHLFAIPVSLSSLSPTELENQYVEYDMWLTYDEFAEMVMTSNGTEYSEFKDYLFPVEEKYYLSVRIYHKDYEEFNQMVHDSMAWSNYETDYLPEPYSIKGVIQPLDEDELPYFYEYLQLSEAEAQQQGFYALVVDTGDKVPGSTSQNDVIIRILVSFIFCFIGFILLYYTLTMKNHRDLIHYLEEHPEKEESLQNWVNSELAEDGFRINSELCFYLSATKSILLNSMDILWLYIEVSQQRVNFIPVQKQYFLKIGLRDGSFRNIMIRNEEEGQRMIQKALSVCPSIVTGYSKELKQMFAENRTVFESINRNQVND